MMLIFTTLNCSWCTKAKKLMDRFGISYTEEIFMGEDRREWFRNNVAKTFPQIFDAEGNRIGGYDELEKWIEINYL